MIELNRRAAILAMMTLTIARVEAARDGGWTEPVQVRSEENLCLSYQAKLDGPYLVVRATVEPGWHTFSMDNKQRAEEKLAGKRSLGIDRQTSIVLTGGLEPVGPWYQTPPKDFSKPELRYFSWGFEQQALFVTKVKHTGSTPAKIGIKGQACTETTCKNIDAAVPMPAAGVIPDAGSSDVHLKTLVQVR